MNYLKRTFRITKVQDKTLKKLAKSNRLSQSEIIRQLLAKFAEVKHENK